MAISTTKVEVISREIIKPSSPTPHKKRLFKLSFIGQNHSTYVPPPTFFYPNIRNGESSDDARIKTSNALKESISKTLTQFYPLAGKIKDDTFTMIECNDDGAEYIEARVNCCLFDFLQNPSIGFLRKFIPIVNPILCSTTPLLVIQTTYFDCGGFALSFSMAHTIAGANTMSIFIGTWTAVAVNHNPNPSPSKAELPEFISSSTVFPARNSPIPNFRHQRRTEKTIGRRFVFDGSKIALLRSKASSERVQQTTRVEAVTAMLWKSTMAASRSIRKGTRPSLIIQAVNMRKRLVPPLPESSVGDFAFGFNAKYEDAEIKLEDLVYQLRKGITEFTEKAAEIIKENKFSQMMYEVKMELYETAGTKQNDLDFHLFTSWCKLPWYEADFGLGKPIWVGLMFWEGSSYTILIDRREGDGIEAWMSLPEKEMALVESNEELLQFASLNPSVLGYQETA